MLKRTLVIGALVSTAALTGCATHQQANTAVGAGVGAVVGNAVAGRGGAVVGAVLGTAIGSQHPASPPVVYAPAPVHVYQQRQVCFLNQEVYQARIAGCDAKFRNDPHYTWQHRDGCYSQAKQQAWTCQ